MSSRIRLLGTTLPCRSSFRQTIFIPRVFHAQLSTSSSTLKSTSTSTSTRITLLPTPTLPRKVRRSLQFGQHARLLLPTRTNSPHLLHLHLLPSRFLSTSTPPPPTPSSSTPSPTPSPAPPPAQTQPPELRESPYTLPNALTSLRILACPLLGYYIVQGEMELATGLLVVCGFSDWLDGWIARKFNMASVFGTILDPAADKALMTTLTCTLAYSGLLPIPLAILILGRDVGLSLSAFYYRYISLPEPKTFKRYWDFSIPSAEVKPTQISKYNTALQLLLMGVTTVSPLLTFDISLPLQALQWTVAGTTIWSGFSYVGRKGVNILAKPKSKS